MTCDAFSDVGSDLLEVGSEAVHVLVVGQHGVGLSMEEVDVPDAQQSQQHRSVLIQGSGVEVVVLQGRKGCYFTFLYSVSSLVQGSYERCFYMTVVGN